jgi:hypothetical protein
LCHLCQIIVNFCGLCRSSLVVDVRITYDEIRVKI